ncbi:hypothetical protein M3M39_01160 [Fructilactobacillus hinvesii]|uniref:ABC transporter ATP-binding protein n=1 Tax=Fructilactobacillus hinvesii TaxID=2940300 RepID=A0ABY5BSR7_9LACO|nr:hypothetical protein [Fructilactobacillus hinvesii]USS88122.1 hypothetical protein M3M39_01160 [Fructilactobacillus hinvesii]
MDESTAALDEQTATEIETTLVHQPAITLLMVTHHLQQKIREQLTNVIEINAESN